MKTLTINKDYFSRGWLEIYIDPLRTLSRSVATGTFYGVNDSFIEKEMKLYEYFFYQKNSKKK